ncbi:hypothetical protein C0J52_13683, partial [Blattella germanica]
IPWIALKWFGCSAGWQIGCGGSWCWTSAICRPRIALWGCCSCWCWFWTSRII